MTVEGHIRDRDTSDYLAYLPFVGERFAAANGIELAFRFPLEKGND